MHIPVQDHRYHVIIIKYILVYLVASVAEWLMYHITITLYFTCQITVGNRQKHLRLRVKFLLHEHRFLFWFACPSSMYVCYNVYCSYFFKLYTYFCLNISAHSTSFGQPAILCLWQNIIYYNIEDSKLHPLSNYQQIYFQK